MSSNTVLDFCVLDSCSEDGRVKGRGGIKEGDSGFVYLASRVLIFVSWCEANVGKVEFYVEKEGLVG
jgi:hypothetical protein